jgi:hypothetical protein
MTKIGLVALGIFIYLAAFPGLKTGYDVYYTLMSDAAHGQDPFLFKILAALPELFLVGLFVMPLINWWQAKTPKKPD